MQELHWPDKNCHELVGLAAEVLGWNITNCEFYYSDLLTGVNVPYLSLDVKGAVGVGVRLAGVGHGLASGDGAGAVVGAGTARLEDTTVTDEAA